MPSHLTKKQKRLVAELHQVCGLLHLDFWNVQANDAEERTTRLELAMRQIVMSQVVSAFTLLDEYLNVAMCHYYFGKQKSSIRLWRTKKFKRFNHHILEELYTPQKIRFLKSVRPIPSRISQDIDRLCALRNGLAHAFFPENLRKSQPVWKGESIFGLKGLQRFHEDMQQVSDYFWEREIAGSGDAPKEPGRPAGRSGTGLQL
jgi:hypothetical protein